MAHPMMKRPEQQRGPSLTDLVMRYYNDPLGFVWAMFPWGKHGTACAPDENGQCGPDDWQTLVLDTLGKQLRAQAAPDSELIGRAIRLAVASGHGIGKTALVSWIVLWFISTRPNPQIVVTANTEIQLRTKTWRELSKWHDLLLNKAWFGWSATQLKFKADPSKWFATAIPWSESNPTAFQGTHERHVLIIFDEASEISDIIWETIEGALTTAGANSTVVWCAFGNPTTNVGRFRECWTKFRKRWITLNVDSRTARMASKAQIQEWLEDYGEDSDFFRVRVRGEFPRQGPTQFISAEVAERAQRRHIQLQLITPATPKLMGVDVARQGDDESVILRRWGPKVLPEENGRILGLRVPDLMQVAAHVAVQINKWRPDNVFIDAVGMGAGVYDRLVQLGYSDIVVPCYAGNTSDVLDPITYALPRDEWWSRMKAWLPTADIPPEARQLYEDLIGPQYSYDQRMRIRLEKKEDMKKRGLPSPDYADALALTFAFPVPMKRGHESMQGVEPEVV